MWIYLLKGSVFGPVVPLNIHALDHGFTTRFSTARRMNVYWSVQVLFPCQLSFFSRKPFFPPSTLPLISLLVHNRFIWLIRVTPSVNAVLAGLAAPQVCSCDRRQCSVIVIAFSHSFIRKRSRLRIVTWSAIR